MHSIHNQQQFDKLVNGSGNKLVVIDFSATWCGPCKRIAPNVHELAIKQQDRCCFGQVDVDQMPDVAERFGVETLPTFMFFRNGKRLGHFCGADTKKLEAGVAEHLAAAYNEFSRDGSSSSEQEPEEDDDVSE